MTEEMERDERVFLMGEEVAEYNGAYKVSKGMLDKFGPKRVIDTPISEAAFSGLGAGARACCGLAADHRIHELVLHARLHRSTDEQRRQCALYVRRTVQGSGGLPRRQRHCPTSLARPTAIEWNQSLPACPQPDCGRSQHPVRCQGTSQILNPLLMIRSSSSKIRKKMLAEKGEVPLEDYLLPIGKAKVEREGADVTVVSYGRPPSSVVRLAVEHLHSNHGIDVELIDLRTLRPLDVETIAASIAKTNRCVIIDEDWGYCGMGSAILYKIQKRCFDDLDAPIEYVHSDEIPVPFSHPLEEAMMPSVDRIVKARSKKACYR